MRNQNYVPFFAPCKYPATCPETGRAIAKGERAAFYRINGKWIAYHEESKQASELRGIQFSESWGMMDANY